MGEPISVVKKQIAYYVERFDHTTGGSETISRAAGTTASGSGRAMIHYQPKRATPSITTSAFGTFSFLDDQNATRAPSGITINHTQIDRTQHICTISGATMGAGCLARDGSDTTWIMADARH